MKWLLLLLAAVLLLVVAWLLLAPSAPETPEGAIKLPPWGAEKPALVAAAAQFETYRPATEDVGDAVLLLTLLRERIPAEEWGQVQKPAFVGWEKLKRTPGSQPGLEPMAADLIDRFARWGSPGELETLVRSSNANEYWKPQIDQALLAAARAPVPASGYRGSRLEAVVSATLAAGDFDRAALLLARGAWSEEVTEEGRAPARRLALALDLHGKAKSGAPDFPKTLELWAADAEVRPVLAKAGVRVSRAGRERKDWSLAVKGIEETKAHPSSAEYWTAVLWGVADEAGKGLYIEEETLAALASRLGIEADFWEKVQGRTPGKTYPEAMWRVSCWKRVIRATEDAARREAALAKLLGEHLPYDPRAARRDLQEMKALVGEEAAGRALAGVEKDLAAREAQLATAERKREELKAQSPLRSELEWLQAQLREERARQFDPQVVANMKRRITELEKQLK